MLSRILHNVFTPKLAALSRESTQKAELIIKETVFNSNTMKTLLTDTFVQGDRHSVLVQRALTGEPVKLQLKITQKPLEKINGYEEIYDLIDKYGQLAGRKRLQIKEGKYNKPEIFNDGMVNESGYLNGIGIRLDQIHIERALQLGIDTIKRTSLAQAVLYHVKMGFLPIEKLTKIKNLDELKMLIYDYMVAVRNVSKNNVLPIIKETKNGFYYDENKTHTFSNLLHCKEQLERTKSSRLYGLNAPHTFLELKGKELEYWKQIIKEHPILSK